jgi:hypothetical protein
MAAADSGQKSKRVVETAEMLNREREAVGVLRCDEWGNPKTDGPWLGLALSGGGIRSASFAMGVMQGLQAAKAMKRFDYLSTVSGGGYIGASLSYFLVERAHGEPKDDEFWFPFGRKGQDGARGATMRNPLPEADKSGVPAATRPPQATTAPDQGGAGQQQGQKKEKWKLLNKTLSSIRSFKLFGTRATEAPKPRDWEAFAVQVVSFIRQHAHYLTPSARLGIFALVANALRAVLFSLGIYFAILVIVMAAVFGGGRWAAKYAPDGGCACTLGATQEAAAPKPVCLPVCTPAPSGAAACVPVVTQAPACPQQATAGCVFSWWTPVLLPCAQDSKTPQGGFNFFAILGFGALALAGIVTLIYSIGSYVAGAPAPRRRGIEPQRHYYDRFTIPLTALLGILLQAQLVGLVFGSLPWVFGWAERHGDGNLYGAISVAIAYLGTWREKHALTIGKLTGSPLWKSVWPYLYSILAIYGILFLAFGVSKLLLDHLDGRWIFFDATIVVTGWTVLFGLAILTGLLGIFTNLNLVSQHRMYRDRLMEAMCPDARKVDLGTWGAASVADAMQMSVLAGGAGSQGRIIGPYHLINTALIIPDSKEPKYSGRGADSFVISPRYCGSDATKWSETRTYMGNRMMLPSAMAISGAALNAHSGPDGKGILRTPMVSFLMTLFGVQLGYWAPNPRNPNQFQTKANYLTPGLFGLLGYDMSEKARFLQLSDGGHFENLGLYELIRRKMDLIVVSDGGQDGEFSFADLGNAIERVRVDFGVSIHFDDPDFTLEDVLPQPRDAESDSWNKKFGLAKRGFALASIAYPSDRPGEPVKCGVLIYIKATMIEKLPSDLYAYKAANPEFPDQSTLDQFFDEDQFEAYRELGYRLTKQMTMTLSTELVHKWPVTRRLAKERLDPKPPEQR